MSLAALMSFIRSRASRYTARQIANKSHIVEQVLVRPSSEQYWDIVSGQRITENFLYKSYFCKVKQIKDKKLTETNFKILNNILPCNINA